MRKNRFSKMSEEEFIQYLRDKESEANHVAEDAMNAAPVEDEKEHMDAVTRGLAKELARELANVLEERGLVVKTEAIREEVLETVLASEQKPNKKPGFRGLKAGWKVAVAAGICVVVLAAAWQPMRSVATRYQNKGSYGVTIGETSAPVPNTAKETAGTQDASGAEDLPELVYAIYGEDYLNNWKAEEDAWAYFEENIAPKAYGWDYQNKDALMLKEARFCQGKTCSFLYDFKGQELEMNLGIVSNARTGEVVLGGEADQMGTVVVLDTECPLYQRLFEGQGQLYTTVLEDNGIFIEISGQMEKEDFVEIAQTLKRIR